MRCISRIRVLGYVHIKDEKLPFHEAAVCFSDARLTLPNGFNFRTHQLDARGKFIGQEIGIRSLFVFDVHRHGTKVGNCRQRTTYLCSMGHSFSQAALDALPKVELHCHLELAVRQSTLQEFALTRGYAVQASQDFADAFLIQAPMGELPSVLHKFLNTRDLLDSTAWIERVAFEVCEDMFKKSNVRILELRYAPSFLLDKHGHISADELQEAIQRGVAKAEATYPMAVGLICILQRTKSVETNANWVDFAINHRNGFLALDLADNEVDFDPEPFIPLFQRAKANGLGITVHAGEPLVAGISKNIRTAIEAMGADRIGHGLQAIEDPEVVQLLQTTNTPLELCLTSNWLTGACPSFAAHPFKRLYDAGVKTTINTDDPGIMCTDLRLEFQRLAEHQGMSLTEFQNCINWAYEASFIPEEKKQAAWNGGT